MLGHRWTQHLRATAREFDEHNLDPDDLRLVPVKCELWGGCAWINLDDDAPPLRDCFEPFATIYDAWKVESLRVEWWQSCRLPVNWKLATAAFMEGYHVPQTHPQLLPSAHAGSRSPRPCIPLSQTNLYFMRTLGEGMAGMTHENDIRIAEGLQNIELPTDPAAAMATWRSTLNDAIVDWHRARGCDMPDLNDLARRGIVEAINFAFPHYFLLPTTAAPRPTGSVRWVPRRRSSRSGRSPASRRTRSPASRRHPSRWHPTTRAGRRSPPRTSPTCPRQQKGLHSKGFEFMRLSSRIEGLISNFERVIDGFLAGLPYGALVPGDPEDEHHHRRSDRRSRVHRQCSEAR